MVYSAPMSGDRYDPESFKQGQAYLDSAIDEEEKRRKQQADLEKERQAQEQQIKATTDPKTGEPLPSQETKDPKQFGLKENATELGNAVKGGLVDVANSIAGAVQKPFDPRFYQTDDGTYKPPWVPFSDPPITRTVWGQFLRGAVEFGGLAALTRKASGIGAKVFKPAAGPLNYIAKGPKITPATTTSGKAANLAKNLVHSAVVGAVSDPLSNQTSQSTMVENLKKLKPEWSDALQAFSPAENATPLQRTIIGTFEGLGIGPVADIIFEGAQGALKLAIPSKPKASQLPVDPDLKKLMQNDAIKSIDAAKVASLKKQDLEITRAAQEQAERDFLKNPLDNKKFANLSPEEQFNLKVKVATRQKRQSWLDQYTTYDPEKRARVQANNETEVAMKRLQDEFDDPTKPQEFDGYINDGGDSTQGRAFSNVASAVDTLRDVHQIKTEWTQSQGTPRSPLTEVEIERITSVPGGVKTISQEMLDRLSNDPAYQELVTNLRANGKAPDQFFNQIYEETSQALAGRKVFDLTDDELKEFYGGDVLKGNNPNKVQGVEFYSIDDHLKTNVMLSLLEREMRDLARVAKSVENEVDITAKDGIYDRIEKRWMAFQMGLKQSRYMRSIALSELKVRPTDVQVRLNEIKTSVQEGTTMIREALDGDKTDDLLRLITDAYSTVDNIQSWDDLDNLMRKTLRGYKDETRTVQGMRAREMGATMVHSVLSGGKTPMRQTIGNTLITTLRPIETALGATGSYLRGDDRVMRTAFAQLHSMQEALGDSWKLFRQNLSSNFRGEGVPDLQTIATSYTTSVNDAEFEMVKAWVDSNRGESERALFAQVSMLRGLNKNPFLTWSSKVMAATDIAFQHIIGRMRLKEVAFNKAYDLVQSQSLTMDDAAMSRLVHEYEKTLHSEVFDADGSLKDQLAQRSFKEVAMTGDLPPMLANIETALQQSPWLRPFMLFARTSYNAILLTGKHTPILNRKIKEVHDIYNLPSDHPDLAKYGINNPAEHEAAKALMRGREAMATSIVSMAAFAAVNGQLTGNGPSEKQLRGTWEKLGWQPRSIRIMGKWVSYEPLEPFNMFLSFTADVVDLSKEMGPDWTEKMLDRGKYLLVANIVNKSFMQGLSQLAEITSQTAVGDAQRILAGMVNNQIPLSSLRNDIGKLFNPGMRELSAEFEDSIANRNLWAGELADLPYKRDVLNGKPLKLYDFGTRMWNTVMPFQINMDTTPTRELLFRSLYDVKTTFNTMPSGGELPPKLKSKFQAYMGQQNVESQLTNLFKNPQIIQSIQRMEQERNSGRRDVDPMTYMHNEEISKIMTNAKKQAWVMMTNDTEVSPMIKAQMDRKAVDNFRKNGQYDKVEQYQQILNPPFGK